MTKIISRNMTKSQEYFQSPFLYTAGITSTLENFCMAFSSLQRLTAERAFVKDHEHSHEGETRGLSL